jgi:hypothetical protein
METGIYDGKITRFGFILVVMEPIGVDCVFRADGRIEVRRVALPGQGRWLAVEQGRQWVDQLGRHVLVMLPGNEAREIVLRPETMTWVIRPAGRGVHLA